MRVLEAGLRAPEFTEPLLSIYGLNFYDDWRGRIELLENAVDPRTLEYKQDPIELHLPRIGLNIKDDLRPINPIYHPDEFLTEAEQLVAIVLRFASELNAGREYNKTTLQRLGREVINLGSNGIEEYLKVPKDAIPLFGQRQRDAQNEALAKLIPLASRRQKKQIYRHLGILQIEDLAA